MFWSLLVLSLKDVCVDYDTLLAFSWLLLLTTFEIFKLIWRPSSLFFLLLFSMFLSVEKLRFLRYCGWYSFEPLFNSFVSGCDGWFISEFIRVLEILFVYGCEVTGSAIVKKTPLSLLPVSLPISLFSTSGMLILTFSIMLTFFVKGIKASVCLAYSLPFTVLKSKLVFLLCA